MFVCVRVGLRVSCRPKVSLGGGQVRIRDARYSVSTVPFDLVFDKFATVSVVEDPGGRVTATEKIKDVELCQDGSVCDIAVIYLAHTEVEIIKVKDGSAFHKMAITVCDASVNARFEVHIHGKGAHAAEVKLADASRGDPVVLRGVVFESQSEGYKAVLRKGGVLTVQAGVAEAIAVQAISC